MFDKPRVLTAAEAKQWADYNEVEKKHPDILLEVFGAIWGHNYYSSPRTYVHSYKPEGQNQRFNISFDRWEEFRAVATLLESFGYHVTAKYGGTSRDGTWHHWEVLDEVGDRTQNAHLELFWRINW